MEKFSVLKIACIIFVVCAATAISSPAQSFTTLHKFDYYTDGENPAAGLVQATDGNFYGTTSGGGAYTDGTVFKITPDGTLTTLHNFDATDGAAPSAGLVQATDGNFYGTTSGGGAYTDGTVFKITADGTLTTLHSFDFTDGSNPAAGLVQGTDGNFYGTTFYGGNGCYAERCGTVFKITPSGTLTTLHSFDQTDGGGPAAGLVQATDGNFYGTTYGGNGGVWGQGTVFKITPSGTLTTLHSFVSNFTGGDGIYPDAGLVQGTDGNFYGTTYYGGVFGGYYLDPNAIVCTTLPLPDLAFGCGTVFKLIVQTPQQATQAIINVVNALASQGVLNKGQDNSLVVKLEHAIKDMNAGNDAAASRMILNAFIGEVNDLLTSGVLSPSQAALLVSYAHSVIAQLS